MNKLNKNNQKRDITLPQPNSYAEKAYFFYSLLLICFALTGFAQRGPVSSVGFAYIPNTGDNTVSVLNLSTNSVTATLAVGVQPYGVSVTPDGSKVYVSNFGDNTLTIINSSDNSMITITTGIGNGPTGLCVTPDGKSVYVVNQNDNTVSVIKTLDNSVIATIPVITPIFAFMFLRERITWLNLLGLILSFLGVAFLVMGDDVKNDASPMGIALLMCAVAAAIGYGVMTKKLSVKYSSLTIITIQNVFGVFFFVPLFFIFDFKDLPLVMPSTEVITSVLFYFHLSFLLLFSFPLFLN